MFCAQLTRASLRDPSASKNPDDYVRQHQCSSAGSSSLGGGRSPANTFPISTFAAPLLKYVSSARGGTIPPDIIMKGTQAGMELVLLSKHARRRSIGLDYWPEFSICQKNHQMCLIFFWCYYSNLLNIIHQMKWWIRWLSDRGSPLLTHRIFLPLHWPAGEIINPAVHIWGFIC